VDEHSTETPVWQNSRGFERDVFTFTRVRRGALLWPRRKLGDRYADSDLNLSFVAADDLVESASRRAVSPADRRDLSIIPFILYGEPGSLQLTADEIVALRKYCSTAGFSCWTIFGAI